MSNIQKTKSIFEREDVKQKLQEMLGKRASSFTTSVMSVVSSNKLLANVDPNSIYLSAMMAASLDLPVNQNLGFAWIVPYGGSAQFQIGYKGLIQLAQRTGQYDRINVISVYENQFKSFNYLTEELIGDFSITPSGNIVGYAAYFRLVNGFEKLIYWTKEQVDTHGKRFSKTFNSGPWKSDYDAMAKKTLLKNMLSHWGIMSVEMQNAVIADQAVINDVETMDVDYVDNDGNGSEELPSVTPEELEQMKEGLSMGTVTLAQLTAEYDLTSEQIAELEGDE